MLKCNPVNRPTVNSMTRTYYSEDFIRPALEYLAVFPGPIFYFLPRDPLPETLNSTSSFIFAVNSISSLLLSSGKYCWYSSSAYIFFSSTTDIFASFPISATKVSYPKATSSLEENLPEAPSGSKRTCLDNSISLLDSLSAFCLGG